MPEFTFAAIALQHVLRQHHVDITSSPSSVRSMLAQRIDAALTIAVAHGHQHIVFGSWGCEHGEHLTRMVAQAFKDVLETKDGAVAQIQRIDLVLRRVAGEGTARVKEIFAKELEQF